MKKIILLLILTIVLFIAGCDLGNQSNTETASSSNTGEGNDVLYVIEITSEGFSPSPLTVTQGSTVTWINKDANFELSEDIIKFLHSMDKSKVITKRVQ